TPSHRRLRPTGSASMRSTCVVVMSALLIPPRRQIEARENHEPHAVDEMPVQRRVLDRERIPRMCRAAPLATQRPDEKQHTERDVRSVESSYREEDRFVCVLGGTVCLQLVGILASLNEQ